MLLLLLLLLVLLLLLLLLHYTFERTVEYVFLVKGDVDEMRE